MGFRGASKFSAGRQRRLVALSSIRGNVQGEVEVQPGGHDLNDGAAMVPGRLGYFLWFPNPMAFFRIPSIIIGTLW